MVKTQLFFMSFIIWFLGILVGAIVKIMHFPYGDLMMAIAMISYLIFACMVIYEVVQSGKIERIEKSMWVIGMIFFSAITGILYFLVGRKRIAISGSKTNSTSSLYEN